MFLVEFALGSQRKRMLEKNSSWRKRNLIRSSDLKGDFKEIKASNKCFKASFTSNYRLLVANDAVRPEKNTSSQDLHRDKVKNKRVSLYKQSSSNKHLIHQLHHPYVKFEYENGPISSSRSPSLSSKSSNLSKSSKPSSRSLPMSGSLSSGSLLSRSLSSRSLLSPCSSSLSSSSRSLSSRSLLS